MSNPKDISELIQVTADPTFVVDHQLPNQNYVYTYTITIVNHSDAPVKLLTRRWVISDGPNVVREVEGEGVVGVQPILSPGDEFQYQSWCPLQEEFGQMSGSYTFLNMKTDETFEAKIPPFVLQPDFTLN